MPEALLLCGAPGLALGLVLVSRGRLSRGDLRAMVTLFAVALLVRLVPLNHPAFFHPDLRTHARIAAHVRHLGWSFFRNPYEGLWRTAGEEGRVASGMWIKSIGGAAVGLPYAVAFHSAVAPFDLDEDSAVTAIRVAGGVAAALAPVLVFLLARALLLSTVGAWLCVVVPSLSAELANAAVPATFGHLLDLTFLIWLARTLDANRRPEARPLETSRGGVPRSWPLCYLGLHVFARGPDPAGGRASRGERRPRDPRGAGSRADSEACWRSVPPPPSFSTTGPSSPPRPTPWPRSSRAAAERSRGSESLTTFGSVWPALVAWAAPLGGVLAAFGLVRVLRARGPASAVARLFAAAAFALGSGGPRSVCGRRRSLDGCTTRCSRAPSSALPSAPPFRPSDERGSLGPLDRGRGGGGAGAGWTAPVRRLLAAQMGRAL